MNSQKDNFEGNNPEYNSFPRWLKFLTGGEVAAFALRFLVAAAVDRLGASSNTLVGLLAILKASFCIALVALFPKLSWISQIRQLQLN